MRISGIATAIVHGAHRVTADVDGAPLWFESDDLTLASSPEAYASALLIPAIGRGERLLIEADLSEVWLSNAQELLPIFSHWWGFPELAPQASAIRSEEFIPSNSTALCFSGGVDSFYTLLRAGYAIHQLIFVIGFDVPLDDRERYESFERSLRAVASAVGARPVIIRTNLREHPAFAQISWEITHGGALAAIGHLLSDSVGKFLISSSQAYDQADPWGSHWRTDRFWSSDKLQIITAGSELHRYEKTREIAGEPLAYSNLRVCWENRAPSGNCSRCEKCVRTRLMLAECGELDNYSVFNGSVSLLEDLDALPHSGNIKNAYRALLQSSRLDEKTKRSIRRLIARTKKHNKLRREPRKKRLQQANHWLEQNPLWRKLPWRLRSWINAMMKA
jgi:hypothetical protein